MVLLHGEGSYTYTIDDVFLYYGLGALQIHPFEGGPERRLDLKVGCYSGWTDVMCYMCVALPTIHE